MVKDFLVCPSFYGFVSLSCGYVGHIHISTGKRKDVSKPHILLSLALGPHLRSLVPAIFSIPWGLSQNLPHFYLRLPPESEDKYKQSQLRARLRFQDPCSPAQPERTLIPLRWLCAPFSILQRLLPTGKQRFLGPLEQHVTRPLPVPSPDLQIKMCLISIIPPHKLVGKTGLPKPLAAWAMPWLLWQMPDTHLLPSTGQPWLDLLLPSC